MTNNESDRFDLDPKLQQLIMETTEQVLKDTGLDQIPFEALTPEQIDMLTERMGFEIKAKMTKFFAGLDADTIKEHLEIIDESVEDVKRRFERERKGK